MRNDSAVKRTFLAFLIAASCGMLGMFTVAARTSASTDKAADVERARVLIETAEHDWVSAVTSGDTGVVERTLADDFLGVGPDGKTFDKSVMIGLIRGAPSEFISNRMNPGMTVKFYGTTAIASGSESWERRTAEPKKGQFVWTDTWMLRDGKWQVVAGSDFILPSATD